MSQPQIKRPPPPPAALTRRKPKPPHLRAVGETPNATTMLPPAGTGNDVLSLEAIGGVWEEVPAAIEPPPAEAVTGPRSGVFSSAPRRRFEDKVEDFGGSPLSPYYRERAPAERAELALDDFSPRFSSPLLASSLVPPPAPRAAKRFFSSAVLAVLAAAAGGLVVWFALEDAPVPAAKRSAGLQREPQTLVVPHVTTSQTVAAASIAKPAVETVRPAPAAVVPALTPVVPRIEVAKSVVATAENSAARPTDALEQQAPMVSAVPLEPTAEASVQSTPSADDALASTSSDSAEDEALPSLPTRDDVVAGFEQIRSELEQCAAGKRGVVSIDATIANSGRVGHALVTGAFQGTPEGSCIARAVRDARFPRFAQQSLKVSYPVSL